MITLLVKEFEGGEVWVGGDADDGVVVEPLLFFWGERERCGVGPDGGEQYE